MNINRNTYEEFFLMYVDNELSSEERKAVELFIEENPDLREELEMLQDVVLKPEAEISFDDKKSLFRTANPVTTENCEEYFILYSDDELSLEEKEYTEQFVYRHPEQQQNFELFQAARLSPDRKVIFPDKEKLYRREKKEGSIIFMSFTRFMAAASVLLVIGLGGWYLNNSFDPAPVTVSQNTPSLTLQNSPLAEDKDSAIEENRNTGSNESIAESPAPEKAINRHSTKLNQQAENKSYDRSNINTDEIVKQESNTLKNNLQTNNLPDPVEIDVALHQPKKETFVIDEAIGDNELINNKAQQSMSSVNELPEELSSDVIFVANTTVSKKNQFRGLFRKASRFFEKATNIDPINKDRGIRIANFEFALK